MQFNLREKIIVIISMVLLVTIGFNILVNSLNFRNEYSDALKSDAFTVGRSLNLQLEKLLSLNIPLEEILGFDTQCHEIVKKYPFISFAAVTNTQGKIIYSSDSCVNENYFANSPLIPAIKSGTDNVVEYKHKSQKYYAFTIAIKNDRNSEIGAIVLCLPQTLISSKVRVSFWYSLLISFSFLMISMLLITWAISKWVTAPLKELDRATHIIITDGTDAFKKIPIKSKDEIGRLGDSFNLMGQELQKTTISIEYMNKIISSITDALFVINSDLTIKTVNESSCRMLLYTNNELIGKSITDIFHPDRIIPFKGEHFSVYMQNGVLQNHETIVLKKDGERIPVLLSCAVMDDSSGNVKSIVMTLKDITERKIIEETLIHQASKLTRTNTQMREFVYIASHDLQEPLRKICAFSDRIHAKYMNIIDDQGKDYLTRIQNAGIRMQTLINDLLEYSRITTKARAFTEVNLQQIGEDVTSDLQIRTEQTNGQIRIIGLPVIEADATQMRQLFQNIIGNALKFHKEGVSPVINVYSTIYSESNSGFHWQTGPDMCAITFEDNGIGIEEQYYQKIFGVFQRLHGKNQYEGTGVGLAICQKIVERHNGQIKVESRLGEGTKFIVTLPVKQKEHSEGQE